MRKLSAGPPHPLPATCACFFPGEKCEVRSRVCADVSTKPQQEGEEQEEEQEEEEEEEEERFSQTARGQSSLGCCSTAGHRGLKMEKKIFPAKKRIRQKSLRKPKNGENGEIKN